MSPRAGIPWHTRLPRHTLCPYSKAYQKLPTHALCPHPHHMERKGDFLYFSMAVSLVRNNVYPSLGVISDNE